MGLGALLVISIGLLVILTKQGRQKPDVIVTSVPSQEKPSSFKVSGEEVKKSVGAIPVASAKEESDFIDAFLLEKYKNYLDKAEKYYKSGEYELAKRNVELAGGFNMTAQVEALKQKIESTLLRRSKQGTDQVSNKQEIDRKQTEVQADDAAWGVSGAIGGAGTKEALQKYLMDYPTGRHSDEAKRRIAEIKEQAEEAERKQKEEEEAKAGQGWREPVTGMEFVFISGGEFYMGADNWDLDEKPVHKVFVDGFWMGKNEVTQGQWQAVMESNPSYFKNGYTYPVEQVSWKDAQDFIRRLNAKSVTKFRLPTEAEWEYASRAGTSWDSYSSLNDIGWGKVNSGGTTHPIGQKRPNSFGLYDMLGNVWEWCQDLYGNYSGEYARNPVGPPFGGDNRIIRGGSYRSDAQYLRSASRNSSMDSMKYNHLGFRLARTK